MSVENIYAIASGPEDNPSFHYVGKTVSDVDVYFRFTHKKNYDNGIVKSLYEHMRHHGGIEAFRIIKLDDTTNGMTEADYVRSLTLDGHKLLNDNKGNSKVAAKPSRAKSLFAQMNREAEQRIELAERASHRKILHGKTQQLSKSEIVGQRIRGDVPSSAEMSAATYYSCPVEMLGVAIAKRAERAESTQVGDYRVLVAWRNKDKEHTIICRRRDGQECTDGLGRWSRAPMGRALEVLESRMIEGMYWHSPRSL